MADVTELDCLTGEVTVRDFTPEEVAQREKDAADFAAAQEAAEVKAAADAVARAALLERLGISEDEARLLLGGA